MYSPDYFDNASLPNKRRIAPGSEVNRKIHSSTTKLHYSGKLRGKRYSRKSCRHRKCIVISQQSVREMNELRNLTQEFLSHKFSAAGVHYIVRSRSRCRKVLWLATVIGTISFMAFMTFNVIMEYLSYPKMLIRQEDITPKLQFPAVTLCSLNPIFNVTSEKSPVYRMMLLKKLIKKATIVPVDKPLQQECFIHPLCQWSWFNETCECVSNPCLTEFCLPENETHCKCSFNICREVKNAPCSSAEAAHCLCLNNVQVNNTLKLEGHIREMQLNKDLVNGPDSAQELMDRIRSASTYDLRDLEDSLIPSVNDLMQYGIKFDNFVISCSFDGERCNREDFTVLYHSTYGRCYMFNYLGVKKTKDEPIVAYNYGSSSGLRLILHVLRQDQVDLLNSETGARVVVHDPNSLPFVPEDGINVRPHDMSAIEVKKSVVRRLKEPYGVCVDDDRHLKFQLPSGQPYSILGCQKACRNHYIMQGCNCTKRSYILGSVFYQKTIRLNFCKMEDKTQYDCMVRTISQIEQGNISCDCKPPCVETVYSTTVSSSNLNEQYYRAVKSIMTFYTENGEYKTIDVTDPQNLMVGVKVYYSTFQVDADNEQAFYSWETLVANIGGNLGFFMGLTLITFMEILEFLWDIIVTTVRRYTDSKTRSRQVTANVLPGY